MKTMAKNEFDADELNLIKLARDYSDDDKARELLESLRWPNGCICPHCKNDGKGKSISKLTPKASSKSAVRRKSMRRQPIRSLRTLSGRRR